MCIDDEIPFELPKGWTWSRLGVVSEYLHRGKSPNYSDIHRYPVFAQKCNQPEHISLEKVKFADPDTFERYEEECFLQNDDIVINSTGTGTLGRIGLFQSYMLGKYECIVPDSHITVVRTRPVQLSHFIRTILKSDYGQALIFSKQTGSTNQKELPTREVILFLVPIAPLGECARIEETIQVASSLASLSK